MGGADQPTNLTQPECDVVGFDASTPPHRLLESSRLALRD